MEAEKPHDFPSVQWRPRRASGVIPVQMLRSEKQEGRCPRAGELSCPSPSRERITLPLPFCSARTLSRWGDAHPHWGGQSASLCLLVKWESVWETLTDTPRKNVLPAIRASLGPIKLTHKVYHHSFPQGFVKNADAAQG